MSATPSEAVVEPAPAFDLFLSYNRLDLAAVDRVAEALRERDLKVFKDDWYLRPGQPWPTTLEKRLAESRAVVVAIGGGGLGPWQQREAFAALDLQDRARKAGREPPPVIPLLLDPSSTKNAGLAFLLQNTWVENWDPRAIDLLAGAVDGKAPAELHGDEREDPRTHICPYRGLGVFREEDAPFYVGREPDLERLVGAVARQRMVAVVGPSGSGKSSLARAGLVPHLRRQREPDVWQVADMVPGGNPFLGLARALLPLREPARYLEWSKSEIDDECKRLSKHLATDGAAHIRHVVDEILAEEPGTTRLLLLVDQWEELYTHAPGDGGAAAAYLTRVEEFVAMLTEAVRGDALSVVLTLRADYWGEVLNEPRLAARLSDDGLVHLRALDRPALERIVREPARKTGLEVPDALVEALLNDAAGRPGDLPLLEFALEQLWLKRRGHTLALGDYRTMGGLERSIVAQAEDVYVNLDPAEKEAVPGLFAALVQVGESRTDLRRRARLAELSAEAREAVRRFADRRLLVTGREWTSGEDVVEVAHEALLRAWPRLERWVEARRDALLTVRVLQAETRRWIEKKRDPAFRWSHERVREAAGALAELASEVVLDDDERAFLGPIDPAQMRADLDKPETSHAERAFIGDRLAVLGDPRPGVGVDDARTPVIAWCQVPGGEVAIDVPRRLLGGTRPLRRHVDAFEIAAFPVTVAQYRAFLDAEEGWRDERWWDGLYRDPTGDSFDVGTFANHPATYVNWFDALAFCRWLGHRTNRTVRLPTEWEWQQAATGGIAGRTYPWGPGWDPDVEPHRANTFESRLGRVTAVGVYPAGASPIDAFDMAGNVFEWCANKHDRPEITAARPDDFDPRVLRGGSWYFDLDFARCAFRNSALPSLRDLNVGFRVVCSSPMSSADR